MAEIKIERKHSVLPWILGLVLLVLVIWGVARTAHHGPVAAHHPKATAADASWDNIPPRLRQYA